MNRWFGAAWVVATLAVPARWAEGHVADAGAEASAAPAAPRVRDVSAHAAADHLRFDLHVEPLEGAALTPPTLDRGRVMVVRLDGVGAPRRWLRPPDRSVQRALLWQRDGAAELRVRFRRPVPPDVLAAVRLRVADGRLQVSVPRSAEVARAWAAAVASPPAAGRPPRAPAPAFVGPPVPGLGPLIADPAPPAIIRGTHYVVSNEDGHHHWRASLDGLGGVHVGVGAEQNYLLAGWSRAEWLVLVDFDVYIPWLHRVHGAAFRAAETPAAYLALWGDGPGLAAAVDAAWTGVARDEARQTLGARRRVERRLRRLEARHRAQGVPCYLTDPAQYAHLRALWLEDRVRALRGDLLGRQALRQLGAGARAAGLVVRSLYVSNAESYFGLDDPRYRDNVLALPFDARSLVLRTFPYRGGRYRFYEQPAQGFAALLAQGAPARVWMMLQRGGHRRGPEDWVLPDPRGAFSR